MNKKLIIITLTFLICLTFFGIHSSMVNKRMPFIDIVEHRDYVAEVVTLIDAFGGHLVIPIEEYKADFTVDPVYYLWGKNLFNRNREDIRLEKGYVQLDTLFIAVNQLKEDYTYGHDGIQVTEKKGSFTLSGIGSQVLLVHNGYVYGEITEVVWEHDTRILLEESEKILYDDFKKLLSEKLR